MAFYTYKCENCDNSFTEMEKMSLHGQWRHICKIDGGNMEQVLYPVAVKFNGPGWYADGYTKNKQNSVDK